MTIIPSHGEMTKAPVHRMSCVLLDRLERRIRGVPEGSRGLEINEVDGCCELAIDWIFFPPRNTDSQHSL